MLPDPLLLPPICLQNFGHTLAQDGDSFSVIFEDPADAVRFTLQVQLLMQRQKWPRGLLAATASLKESTSHLAAGEPVSAEDAQSAAVGDACRPAADDTTVTVAHSTAAAVQGHPDPQSDVSPMEGIPIAGSVVGTETAFSAAAAAARVDPPSLLPSRSASSTTTASRLTRLLHRMRPDGGPIKTSVVSGEQASGVSGGRGGLGRDEAHCRGYPRLLVLCASR